MTERTYPYTAWILQPSFKPKQVELVEHYSAFGGGDYGDMTASSKIYRRDDIFSSKAEAIEEGWRRVEKQQADLEKRQESLNKKKTALTKAATA